MEPGMEPAVPLDATVIVTTSAIPSHPSTALLDATLCLVHPVQTGRQPGDRQHYEQNVSTRRSRRCSTVTATEDARQLSLPAAYHLVELNGLATLFIPRVFPVSRFVPGHIF